MKDTRESEAVRALKADLERLEQDEAELRARLGAVAEERSRVARALKVLCPNEEPKRSGKSGGGVSTGEVVEAVERILKERGGLKEPELSKALGAEISKLGKSRTGLHLGLKRALKDGRFTRSGSEWRLSPSAEKSGT